MGQVRGYLSELVLDFESTFGADPGVADGQKVPFNSFGLVARRAKNQAQTLTGTRHPVAPFDGNLDSSGDAVIPVDVRNFGFWLRAMFGAPTTTGTDPYTHVFKPGNVQPSLVADLKYADPTAALMYAKHNGVKVSTFGMEIGGDGELVANLGLLGASRTKGASAYDATAADRLSFSRFSNFQAAIEEGGASIAYVTGLSFDIDFGLDPDQYVIGGGGVRGDIPEGALGISGTLTALFQSDSLLEKAINSTESSLKATFTSGAHSLEIFFPELQYEEADPPVNGPQGLLLELPFMAYYNDNSDTSSLKVTLVNDQAGTVYGAS